MILVQHKNNDPNDTVLHLFLQDVRGLVVLQYLPRLLIQAVPIVGKDIAEHKKL